MAEAICSISTPFGLGAISIIKASGDNVIFLANKLFKGKDLTKAESHTINYGHIVYNGEVIDEVLVSVFKPPKTYTKEETVEINCHGGIFVTKKVLSIMLQNGFRLAEPGEFTKRAYLNGRIDLLQAESVMDVISSENDLMLKEANHGLRKDLSDMIINFRNEIVQVLASIEVNIDYPEYEDIEVMTNEIILPPLLKMEKEIDKIIKLSNIGQVLKDGIDTAIIGKPNVGKSSILNMLLDEDKAIVSEFAGTTRDIVEGRLNLGDIILNLVDTAGIHESDDFIEKIGIQKTKEFLDKANLVLLVIDNSNVDEVDYSLLELTKNKNRIVILNKEDLNKEPKIKDYDLLLSTKDNHKIAEIKEIIMQKTNVSMLKDDNVLYLNNIRQISTLESASKAIKDAIKACHNLIPVDMIEIDIKKAWDLLGEVVGISSSSELIDTLFSKFCLGK